VKSSNTKFFKIVFYVKPGHVKPGHAQTDTAIKPQSHDLLQDLLILPDLVSNDSLIEMRRMVPKLTRNKHISVSYGRLGLYTLNLIWCSTTGYFECFFLFSDIFRKFFTSSIKFLKQTTFLNLILG